MNGVLIDTHVFLWAALGSPKLTKRHSEILLNEAMVYLSIASIWEISIKAALGKLDAPDNVAEDALQLGFTLLPIAPAHAEAIRHLPLHHGDPFDRMLVAQAQTERLSILSSDAALSAYDVRLI